MALTKAKKGEVVSEVTNLLSTSKMTVIALYQGTNVKAMQELRRLGRDSGTTLKVIKNRLFKQALAQTSLKDVDIAALEGMLLYAFNSEDEVAPAQTIASFAKRSQTLSFVGALSADGKWLTADDVKALADLPGKPQLIATVIATLAGPLNDVTNALAGNLTGLLDAVAGKAAK